MGKKSKRKAAKAAAAAAGGPLTGGSNSSNGQQLILGPRPDGIVCTNEDHNLCAVCSAFMPEKTFELNMCCGTLTCEKCSSRAQCPFCRFELKTAHHQQQLRTLSKKMVKAGFPWAVHYWADRQLAGMPNYNPTEAIGLYERAAEKNHPLSCSALTHLYTAGEECKKNIEKAQIMFEKAARLRAEDYAFSRDHIFWVGFNLARELLDAGHVERGLSILLPFAERGNSRAQSMLGDLHDRVGDFEGSQRWYTSSSENPDHPLAALASSIGADRACLGRYWYGVASKIESDSSEVHEVPLLKRVHKFLHNLRQECAWCLTSLDRSTRKMCKGCKALCYCSEDCQRADWNAEKNGHRSDCQKVQEVKKKVAMTKK